MDRAEVIARSFLDHVGDDEIATIRSEFGERLDDAEVGITLRQIEGAKFLLVGSKPVGVVSVVGLQEAKNAARLPSEHLLAKPVVREGLVAEDVDRSNLGEVALVNFEDDVDAVLVELHDLRIDACSETTLTAIKLEDSINVGARFGAGEDLPRSFLDLRHDLVVLEALVPLKDDSVDDRIFANVDDEVAGFGARDVGVSEEPGRVQVLDGLIERGPCVGLPDCQVGICAHRFRLEPLRALNDDRMDCALGRGSGSHFCRRSLSGSRLGCRRLRIRRRLLRGRSLRRQQRRGGAAEHGADQKQRAGSPAKSRRP